MTTKEWTDGLKMWPLTVHEISNYVQIVKKKRFIIKMKIHNVHIMVNMKWSKHKT